jgi:hypothetical protein
MSHFSVLEQYYEMTTIRVKQGEGGFDFHYALQEEKKKKHTHLLVYS